MSTKLVKLHLPLPLHRWIKTVATWRDKEIGDYISELLKEHVPKELKFSDATAAKPKNEKTAKDSL